jgi:predicted nucleotidyltransferase
MERQMPLTPKDTNQLATAIYHTIRYYDLFNQPVTAVQIWRSLIVESFQSHLRWAGRHVYSLKSIQASLISMRVAKRIESKWGYFFLKGKAGNVTERMHRLHEAQDKWKLTQRLIKFVSIAPFVKGIAMAGSLAEGNTRADSDLDVLVIATRGRIWTARLILIMLAQLTGHRRKHWDDRAPDKLCLNHYITDNALAVNKQIRNLYTAISYRHLIPIYGQAAFEEFYQANVSWQKKYLMYPEPPHIQSSFIVHTPYFGRVFKKIIEAILLEPVGNAVERWAEKIQRSSIARHTLPGQVGRVVLSNTELAFHPDTKVPGLLQYYAQEAGQQTLI